MLNDKIARVKILIAKREEIEAELAQLLGVEPRKPRGRQAKPGQSEETNNRDGSQ